MAIKKIGIEKVELHLIKRSETQARQADIDAGIDDLIRSIANQGLLEPVSVVERKKNEAYELIDGQRRFLAYQKLAESDTQTYSKIDAVVYEDVMEDWEKKNISICANITQEPMRDMDKINSITALYNHFGGKITEVARMTGMSDATVRKYVKYARLPETLRELVDDKKVIVDVALQTADAYVGTNVEESKLRDTALEIQKMQKKQRKKVTEWLKQAPEAPVTDVVEKVKTQKQEGHEITITVLSDTYEKIDKYKAQTKNPTIEGAVGDLVEDGIKANDL